MLTGQPHDQHLWIEAIGGFDAMDTPRQAVWERLFAATHRPGNGLFTSPDRPNQGSPRRSWKVRRLDQGLLADADQEWSPHHESPI